MEARVATPEEGVKGDPATELLSAGRMIAVPIPTAAGTVWRLILTETFPRYAATFGGEAMAFVRCGTELTDCPAERAVPERPAVLVPEASAR